MFDSTKVRSDFPIFKTKLSSAKPLVYLDSAATSQKPQVVIDALVQYYVHDNANVHRGIHELGDRSTKAWHEARKAVAEFMGAKARELIAVRGTTEAINMVAYAWGDANVASSDTIIGTVLDHHSNLVPWQQLAVRTGAKLKLVPVTSQGELDLNWLEAQLKIKGETVKVVVFPEVSNTLGTITSVKDVVNLVKKYQPQAVVVIDAAQSAPHLKINFDASGADFMAVSAHKMLGPMGVGGLFVRQELLEKLKPWQFGGGMIGEVADTSATFADDPEDRFTAGTPDVAGMVGWAAACRYLSELGMQNVSEHDRQMVQKTMEMLKGFSQVKIVGPSQRCGSVTFIYEGVHAHDVASILASEAVAVRSGHHCTMPLHKHMGWAATTRVSFNVYSTFEDIKILETALKKIAQIFS